MSMKEFMHWYGELIPIVVIGSLALILGVGAIYLSPPMTGKDKSSVLTALAIGIAGGAMAGAMAGGRR